MGVTEIKFSWSCDLTMKNRLEIGLKQIFINIYLIFIRPLILGPQINAKNTTNKSLLKLISIIYAP